MANKQMDRMRAFKERLQKENVKVRTDAATLTARNLKECPASFAQHRLWLTHRLQPESPFYNVTLVASLRGRLDREALEKSLRQIVQRHDTFRTYFRAKGGKPFQIVSDQVQTGLEVDAFGQNGNPPPDDAVQERIREISCEAFDLAEPPLFRFHLLPVKEDESIVVFCFHHIIFDHHSEAVFLAELTRLYRAFRQGGEPDLKPLRIQYTDYSEYQRQRLTGRQLEKLLKFWKEHVGQGDEIPQAALPFRLSGDRSMGFTGEVVKGRVEKEDLEALRHLAKGQNKSLFAVSLGAFAVLLQKYTQAQDVLISFPVSNRDKMGLEELIGFFVNLVVLRTRLDQEESVETALEAVWKAYLESIEHQELPFEKLVEAVDAKRYHGTTRLSQTVFGYRRLEEARIEVDDLVIEPEEFESQHAKFELSLLAVERGRQLDIHFEFNSQCYDRRDIERFCSNYLHLLSRLPQVLDVPLERLDLVSPQERRQQLETWNGESGAPVSAASVLEIMEETARQKPHAAAVWDQDGQTSYQALHRRANQWARFLEQEGVGPEVPVGLCRGRRADTLAALLGILKCGGAYLALDPETPARRLKQMVKETGLRFLLGPGSLQWHLETEGPQCRVLDFQAAESQAEGLSSAPCSWKGDPQHLAYVLMTSGSSGKPKGVMVSHRNLLNSTLTRLNCYSGEVKRFLLLSPLYFDSSVAGLFWTLSQGGCLVLPEEGRQREVDRMADLCRDQQISHLLCIPGLYSLLIDHLEESGSHALEKVIVAGEVCPADLTAKHHEAFGQVKLFNEYGPTEGTVWSSVFHIEAPDAEGAVPIGRPVGSQRVYLLDPRGRLLPAGGQGEICIGGSGVSRGYCGRSAETAGRYIPDAFGQQKGARLYRTGDLGRWRGDGQLLYEGRRDDEIKIRGYRIALGEVEAALSEHPEVEKAAVVTVKNGDQLQLVGFAQTAEAGSVNGQDLQAHLRQRLPEPMTPSQVHILASLPQLPNGKLDRKRLQSLEGELKDARGGGASAAGPVEDLIADAWRDVLGVDQIGLDDNFFDVGGHSLLATQLASRMQSIFGNTLSLQKLFENPTVRGLARVIQQQDDPQSALAAPQVKPISRDTQEFPLSLQQQRLWFLAQTHPGSVDYNLPRAIRLRGQLDRQALSRSIGEIVRRHHVLRASFSSAQGRPFMHVQGPDEWAMETDQISMGEAEDPEEALARRIGSEVEKPFDLEGKLMRVLLLKCGDDDHVLFFNMHHIISDGWSLGLLIRELQVLYNAYAKQESSPLPELQLQYFDYADWQRNWMRGEVLEHYLDFWQETLSGIPQGLALPYKPGAPTGEPLAGRALHFEIPLPVLQDLNTLCRQASTTLFMALQTVFAATLAWYSGSRDIVLGTSVANRREVALEPLIGFFANTLLLRTDLEGDITFHKALDQARQYTLRAFAHQEVPLDSLVKRLRGRKEAGEGELFDAFFVLHNEPIDDFQLAGLEAEFLDTPNPTTMFKLSLSMAEKPSGLWYMLHYDSNYFERETIENMGQTIDRVIRLVLEDPDQPLFDLLSENLQVSLPSIL